MRLMVFALVMLGGCAHVNTVHGAKPVEHTPGLGPEDVVPSLPAASACADAKLLTLEQVLAGEGAHERIAIDAVPEAHIMCTALLCRGGNGCCNGCGGQYVVRLQDKLVITLAKVGGCGGMDCDLHCEPFGRKPTHRYRFVGMNDFKPVPESQAIYATSQFTVEKTCLAP